MNYKQIVKLLLFSLAFSPVISSAQNNTKIKIESVVRTPDGEPIAGAVINGNDRETYAITAEDGSFSVDVSAGSAFVVSFWL